MILPRVIRNWGKARIGNPLSLESRRLLLFAARTQSITPQLFARKQTRAEVVVTRVTVREPHTVVSNSTALGRGNACKNVVPPVQISHP